MLLRDLRKGKDEQIASIIAVIATVAPDVLLLTDFDYDSMALSAFVQSLGAAGLTYDHTFTSRPNTGLPTGLDMDGNGRTGEARDVQGYGRFSGDGGMAVLSRFPIDQDNVENLSDILWRDVAGGTLPAIDVVPFPSQQAQGIQRLSTSGHWVVPIAPTGAAPFHLLAWSATPHLTGPKIATGAAIVMRSGFGNYILTVISAPRRWVILWLWVRPTLIRLMVRGVMVLCGNCWRIDVFKIRHRAAPTAVVCPIPIRLGTHRLIRPIGLIMRQVICGSAMSFQPWIGPLVMMAYFGRRPVTQMPNCLAMMGWSPDRIAWFGSMSVGKVVPLVS